LKEREKGKENQMEKHFYFLVVRETKRERKEEKLNKNTKHNFLYTFLSFTQ